MTASSQPPTCDAWGLTFSPSDTRGLYKVELEGPNKDVSQDQPHLRLVGQVDAAPAHDVEPVPNLWNELQPLEHKSDKA